MSASYNIYVIYGFPVVDVTLQVPTPLGKKAPSLTEWLEQRLAEVDTKGEDLLHWVGRTNGRPTPMIGIQRDWQRDMFGMEDPYFIAHPKMSDPLPDEMSLLLHTLRSELGCVGVIAPYITLAVT